MKRVYNTNAMTKTTALAIGDIHVKDNNIEDILCLIDKLCEIVIDKDPDYIILLGDVLDYHARLHTQCMNVALDLIRNLLTFEKPVYVIVGNHDLINNQQFLSENHWMNALKEWDNVTVVDKICDIQLDDNGTKVLLSPFVKTGRFVEGLETYDKKWYENTTLVFGHQELKGCKMGAIVSIEGDEWRKEYPMYIGGHIHDKQRLQPNVYIAGSCMQHAFGESHNKTVALVDLNTGEYEEIPTNLRKKRIVVFNLSESNTKELSKYTNHSDQLRINIRGPSSKFGTVKKSKVYKKLLEEGVKFCFEFDLATLPNKDEYTMEQKKSFDEFFIQELASDEKLKNVFREMKKEIDSISLV
jgi:DNA repair exonuclease SbcCD nuclease subunit